MKNCRICESALAQPDYRADAPAMTSLSTMIDIGTEVFVCRTCGHVQSPDLPDVQGFYDHDYRISLQSDGHDQLYEMSADGPEGPLHTLSPFVKNDMFGFCKVDMCFLVKNQKLLQVC